MEAYDDEDYDSQPIKAVEGCERKVNSEEVLDCASFENYPEITQKSIDSLKARGIVQQ